MKSFTLLGGLAVLMLSCIGVAEADAVEERLQWFQAAKFGMFIHFGVDKKSEFNPVDFDVRQWARIAKAGGMKYVVLTTKHQKSATLLIHVSSGTEKKSERARQRTSFDNSSGVYLWTSKPFKSKWSLESEIPPKGAK